MAFVVAGLGKGRIEALTDGIFATVMTVLVLSLSVPSIVVSSNPDLVVGLYVLSLGSVVLSYVMSFLILAVFWVRHHNLFHFIKNVDSVFIWLNIVFLLTVGFIPVSTELVGRYPNAEVSAVIYGVNLIATGVCVQGIWLYATRRGLLIRGDLLSEEVTERINRRLRAGPLIYFGAILLSLITGHPQIAIAIYVIALVYYVIVSSFGGRLRKKWSASHEG
jgi:uncharacterized membrane protein